MLALASTNVQQKRIYLESVLGLMPAIHMFACICNDAQKYYFEGTYHCMKLTKTDKSVSMD